MPMAEGASVEEEVPGLEVQLCTEEATPGHWDSTVGAKPGDEFAGQSSGPVFLSQAPFMHFSQPVSLGL